MYDLGVFAFFNKKIYNFNFHPDNNCVLKTSRRPLTWPAPHLGCLSGGNMQNIITEETMGCGYI